MLKHFFNEYNQEYSEYKITKNDLNILEQRKFKYNNGEWENYIIDRCTPTSSDLYFFQNYDLYPYSRLSHKGTNKRLEFRADFNQGVWTIRCI